jgi:hypothetical protein
MKTLTIILTIILSSTLMYGQVGSDFDKTVDFTAYKTYTFKGWAKDSDKQLNDLDKKRVEDAFKHEFDVRGLTLDNTNPDIAVTLYIVVKQKTSTTAYTDYTGGFGYGAGWGWGMGAGMGSATTTYSQEDYNEGTVVIDFYDAEKKNMIYQGTLTTVVKEKPQKREKSIPKNIAKLMSKYPVKPAK